MQQKTSEAEENGADDEEKQTLVSSNSTLGDNQRRWPCGIFSMLPTLVVVGIVVASPFSHPSLSTSKSKTYPDNGSSSITSDIANETTVVYQEPDVKQQQITNYIKGSAIIRNIHITHHAGTSLCSQMSKLGPTPGFACMGMAKGKNNATATIEHPWPSEEALKSNHIDIGTNLIGYNETAEWVKFWRPYFHFKSLEYGSFGDLHKTNWEDKDLVSMIVMRHPLERFLAGGKCGGFQTRIGDDPTGDTQDVYWQYANSDCADNYALRVLANESVSC